mmetsp:Transcript_59555/g.94764  ORF Transcript_59555/g.94764 Transcript_59555/m.94764 type:complete len:157 (+) Transcript_59555:62-532(+)|eukprot:CAMPEP_0197020224 /NCGR_PEP_ID=MMETSP1384-20130603/984_1 /TAXON_ID=29189 /ORGANISM="Ammonia sp." /LENGTH=156 /DNA_ID=CAMNT_0042447811 /DNA_START=60 /DNA_END=530 /DNA_ORIENTATION=+
MKNILRLPLQKLTYSLSRPSMTSLQYCSSRHFSDYRYSEDHEWVKVEGDEAVIGISDYAQDSLGEIVFVEFPAKDEQFGKGEVFGQVESVKAASELYMPVTGTVVEVNERLTDEPGLVNSSPEKDGWMIRIKVKDSAEVDALMDTAKYSEFTENLH